MDTTHRPRPVRTPHHLGPEERITRVRADLVREFGGVASPATVSEVVSAARRDLASEVPAEALDEFLHRLAHQRLLTACGGRTRAGAR